MSVNPNPTKTDLKVVILGESGVGKTCLIDRYIQGNFQPQDVTIGAAFSYKQINGYNIAIWDTGGQERFQGLSNFYCRNAGAAILAFDMNDPASFKVLETRFRALLNSAEPNCLAVIVGTKLDQLSPGSRPVPQEGATMYAMRVNSRTLDRAPYFETSSKTGQGVEDVFQFIFSTCLPESGREQRTQGASTTLLKKTVPADKPSKRAKRKGCCI